MLVDLHGKCLHIGFMLQQLTDTQLVNIRRLCLVDTCEDVGCCDVLHFSHALEICSLTLIAAVLSRVNIQWRSGWNNTALPGQI